MIPYGLQRRIRRAPFESQNASAVAADETGERRSPAVERIGEDDSQVEGRVR